MWFNNLLERHFEVLVAYMPYKVSFGKDGGKNNPIKAFRKESTSQKCRLHLPRGLLFQFYSFITDYYTILILQILFLRKYKVNK